MRWGVGFNGGLEEDNRFWNRWRREGRQELRKRSCRSGDCCDRDDLLCKNLRSGAQDRSGDCCRGIGRRVRWKERNAFIMRGQVSRPSRRSTSPTKRYMYSHAGRTVNLVTSGIISSSKRFYRSRMRSASRDIRMPRLSKRCILRQPLPTHHLTLLCWHTTLQP